MEFNRLSLITFLLLCSYVVVYSSRLSSQVNEFAPVYDDLNDYPPAKASPRCPGCLSVSSVEKHPRLDLKVLNHPSHNPPSGQNHGGPPPKP
ncbi:hypothetical protein Sjap_005134 [Stephania japonica]|uniref:Transmembrane protein n=1 Tax=Stephania japonica TaxID=461633 RepID=A0AAP0K3E0_9MAGN